MQRRQAFSGLASLAFVPLAGCLGGPDPQILDQDQQPPHNGQLYTIEFLVLNDGDSGEIDFELKLFDRSGNQLYTDTKITHMRSGEQRRITFTFTPPEGFDSYQLEWEAPRF